MERNGQKRLRRWLSTAAIAGLGFVLGSFASPILHGQDNPNLTTKQIVGTNPQAGTLNATLWMRTSGEYQANCLQTYRLATEAACRNLAANRTASPAAKPPAVIMDLDETVLDNSAFQGIVIQKGERFSDEAFNHWLRHGIHEVRLTPGAKDFIQTVRALGIVVHFVSNRPASEKESTIQTLQTLGLGEEKIAERVHLRTDTSDKTPRRKLVEDQHDVILFVGDQLGDFSDKFNPKHFAQSSDVAQARSDKVVAEHAEFGVRWFILPQPLYGDWSKAIDWDHPMKHLRPQAKP